MANNWTTYTLGDIASLSYGKMPKKELLGQGEYITYSGYKYIEKYPEKNVSKGDVIVVARGVGGTGDVKLVEKDSYLTNLSIKISLDNSKVLNEFFYYLFFQNTLRYLDSGSAQSQITIADLSKLQFKAPDLSEQREILKNLTTLDSKVSINRNTNQTLEQMAQAMFKSWFVDFDPVFDNALASGMAVNDFPEALQKKAEQRQQVQQQIANGELDAKPLPENIRQLFPSEFEQTHVPSIGINGWIPKGWRYSELSELIGVKHGYAYKGEFFSDEPTHDILLTPGNVAVGGGFKGDKLKFYSGPLLEDYIFIKGDMYITMTDLSKAGDTLGFPALVPSIDGLTFHHNQRLGKVEFKSIKQFGAEFIYRCLCSREYRSYIVASATGTTVKHTSPTKILKHKVVNSGGVIEPIFDNYVKNFTAKKELNNSNSIDLAKTRDYLLPKLISGEISINNIQ